MANRLSILAVTSEVPWPLSSGGRLRSHHLLKRLASRHDVRLVVPVTPDRVGDLDGVRAAGIDVVPVPVRGGWLRTATGAASAAVSGRPFVMYARHDHRDLREALRSAARQRRPDAWYFDHLDAFVYADEAGADTVVGDMHNVYSLLVDRTADEQKSLLLRQYLKREAHLLSTVEGRAALRADLIFTVSEDEARTFTARGARRVMVAPNGVDLTRYGVLPCGQRPAPPTVLYLGAMSWEPNAAAAGFLAREVMPEVRRRVPDVRLQIVGRDPSPAVLALRSDAVEVTGGVPDVMPYLAQAHVLAVPLDAGGGTRIKILEAFGAGLPVVSTAVGCEGIRARPDVEIVVAARERFADALTRVLASPAAAEAMARQARALAEREYGWDAIGERVATGIEEAVQAAATPAGPRA